MGRTDHSERAASALGRALLAYVLLAVVLATWAPFRFAIPRAFELTWLVTPFDVVANICLFLPIGFLFYASAARTVRGEKRRWWRSAALLGGCLSVCIEAGQVFIPDRYTSLWDVAANGLGAALGGAAYDRVASNLGRLLPDHPTLELPLMNVVYLCTVSLWLNGLASLEDPWRTVMVPPLALVGTVVLAEVWRFRLAAAFTRHQITLGAVLWFVVAALPSLASLPLLVVACVAVVGGVTWQMTGRRVAFEAEERRFEVPTLRRASVPLGAYLVLLALWPLPFRTDGVDVALHLTAVSSDPTIPQIFRGLEHLVAFTIVGFVIAQWRGRRHEAPATSILWVLVVATLSTIVFQVIKGLHIGMHASVFEGAATILAAVSGGVLYRRQLAALRTWLARSAASERETAIDELLDRFDEP